jgi:hypothetical protein
LAVGEVEFLQSYMAGPLEEQERRIRGRSRLLSARHELQTLATSHSLLAPQLTNIAHSLAIGKL